LKTTPEHTLREDNRSGESVPETTVPEADCTNATAVKVRIKPSFRC